jgi:Uma2 family endonuclease
MSTLLKPPTTAKVPPLESGDRLTRAEFERRYAAMPTKIKAELIEGVVYMASPVRARSHGKPHNGLNTWAGIYSAYTPGVSAYDNATVRLDLDNEAQPDICILIDRGGRARINDDDYIEAAPELVAEVTASTASYELGAKLKAYRRNGVPEYLVWRVQDQAIDWFVLQEGEYELLPPGPDGITRGVVFPGLWLDPVALLRGDLAKVHEVAHKGIASPEHAGFVARLQMPKS